MDSAITSWINALSGNSGALDGLMLAATHFGVPLMIAIVASMWWLASPRPQARHASVAAGLSFCLGLLIAQGILLFYHRMRPYDAGVSHLLIEPTADWSFPSDHAIASFSIVFALLLQQARRWLLLLLPLAALVCFSRVYVGMHYASDILGGVAVALLAAFIVKAAYPRDTKLDRWLRAWF